MDRIKISAYNAEEWLLDRLIAHYPNPHDVRDLLRSFAELSGQIRTTDHAVVVMLDPPDTPIHRRALHGLIDDLNAAGATFPGTHLPSPTRWQCTIQRPPPEPYVQTSEVMNEASSSAGDAAATSGSQGDGR